MPELLNVDFIRIYGNANTDNLIDIDDDGIIYENVITELDLSSSVSVDIDNIGEVTYENIEIQVEGSTFVLNIDTQGQVNYIASGNGDDNSLDYEIRIIDDNIIVETQGEIEYSTPNIIVGYVDYQVIVDPSEIIYSDGEVQILATKTSIDIENVQIFEFSTPKISIINGFSLSWGTGIYIPKDGNDLFYEQVSGIQIGDGATISVQDGYYLKQLLFTGNINLKTEPLNISLMKPNYLFNKNEHKYFNQEEVISNELPNIYNSAFNISGGYDAKTLELKSYGITQDDKIKINWKNIYITAFGGDIGPFKTALIYTKNSPYYIIEALSFSLDTVIPRDLSYTIFCPTMEW